MPNFLSRCFFCVVLSTLIVLASCVSPKHTPSFRVGKKSFERCPLQGLRIVVDPGHGGKYKGAVGSRGLRESDINLAVGLHLWGLLKQAGAEAWLTRTADVDLCPNEKASLGEDLDARSRFSNKLKADLFVSIHHNSDIKDRKKNNTQVFYKLTDSGPSQDLAQCVANELRKGKSLGEIFVFPGNYRVLRNTGAVAILGEASFISNRKNEKQLSRSNRLRREAEDYFLGILSYVQKGIPKVVEHYPVEITIGNAFPQIKARIIGGPGGEAIDPETTKLYLDDLLTPSTFDSQTGIISYEPSEPLKNGKHTFYVEARNVNGNVTGKKPVHFLLSLPPAYVRVSSAFSSLPADGVSSSQLEVIVLDTHGNPVVNGTPIALNASAGRLDTQQVFTLDGRGCTYFVSSEETKNVEITAQCETIIAKETISCGPIDDALVRITIRDSSHTPIDRVRVRGRGVLLGTSDENGLVFIRSEKAGKVPITLERLGYAPQEEVVVFQKGVFRQEAFMLNPREEGLLFGRKFTLDPEPWDDESEKKFGLRPDTEEANLSVVKELKDSLEKAGAMVALTRNSLHQHPTPGERVLVGEKFDGDYFITITHRKGKPYVAHYFRSQTGKHLAQTLAHFLEKALTLRKMMIQEGVDFTIIHPRSPSIVINFGSKYLPKKKEERRKAIAQEARGVYEGLLGFFKNNKANDALFYEGSFSFSASVSTSLF